LPGFAEKDLETDKDNVNEGAELDLCGGEGEGASPGIKEYGGGGVASSVSWASVLLLTSGSVFSVSWGVDLEWLLEEVLDDERRGLVDEDGDAVDVADFKDFESFDALDDPVDDGITGAESGCGYTGKVNATKGNGKGTVV
jgi:hypothetical protein